MVMFVIVRANGDVSKLVCVQSDLHVLVCAGGSCCIVSEQGESAHI